MRIYNKGISGNKVYQLAERWEKDCLEIKPGIISILIGVNDIWHKLNGNYNGTVEIYRNDYISLLERTKKAIPEVKLIICEPFAVKGVKAVDDKWYPDTVHVRELNVGDYPYQQLFDLFNSIRYKGWILLEARTEPADRITAMKEQLAIFQTDDKITPFPVSPKGKSQGTTLPPWGKVGMGVR